MPPTNDPAAKPAAELLREAREDLERAWRDSLSLAQSPAPLIQIRDYPPTGPVTIQTASALEALQKATLDELHQEAERTKALLAMIRAVIKHKQRMEAAKKGA